MSWIKLIILPIILYIRFTIIYFYFLTNLKPRELYTILYYLISYQIDHVDGRYDRKIRMYLYTLKLYECDCCRALQVDKGSRF